MHVHGKILIMINHKLNNVTCEWVANRSLDARVSNLTFMAIPDLVNKDVTFLVALLSQMPAFCPTKVGHAAPVARLERASVPDLHKIRHCASAGSAPFRINGLKKHGLI